MFKRNKDRDSFERDRIIAYKNVFGSIEGKEVLFDLMERHFILDSTGGDPIKEGRRVVVLDILKKCNINLADFERLLKGDQE